MITIEPRQRDEAGFIIEEIERIHKSLEFRLDGFTVNMLFICLSDIYDLVLFCAQFECGGNVFDIKNAPLKQLDFLFLRQVRNIIDGVIR